MNEVETILRKYEDTAVNWNSSANTPTQANHLFDQNHAAYKMLRLTEQGRQGIAQLMNSPSPAVRLLAATHSLAWRESDAVKVLQDLIHGGGLLGFTAKQTLKAYHAGTLSLDW